MRWVVSCTPETKIVAEKLFQGAIAVNYLSINDDERAAYHSLNTAIAEAQTQTFSEDIMFCSGPQACHILNTPASPVRTILSAYFTKGSSTSVRRMNAGAMPGSGFSAGPSTSNSSPENRLVTISISSYTNSHLASGGTPLALKVAQGLGIVNTSDNQWVRSPFANLNFGVRQASGHVVQVLSATEADSIINTLFKSPSFHRHLNTMSLCIRLTFSIYSDAANDGDDFPHWVNEQIVSLWFVNDRHIDEFLETFDNSVKSGQPARIIIGYSKVTSLESVALCADAAAHAWQIVNFNSQFKPISLAGRHNPNRGGGGDGDAAAASPFSRELQASHNFAVNQRRRLLEETAAYLNVKASSHTTGRSQYELQQSRNELEKLGIMYDESEKKFNDLASQLEKEKERFRITEEEAVSIADTIEKSQNAIKEEEERRKTLLKTVVEITKKRDELQEAASALRDEHIKMLRQKAIDSANYQAMMIKEAVERQEEIDQQREKLQKEEIEERSQQQTRQQELQKEIDLLKAENQSTAAIGSIQHQLQERRMELDALRQRQKKLKGDASEIEEQYHRLRGQLISLTADHSDLTRRHATVEEYQTAVAAKREDLRREALFCDELRKYLDSLEVRKNELSSKQLEMEEESRNQIEEYRIIQQEQAEETRGLIEEEIDLLQQHEALIRIRTEEEFSSGIHLLSSDFWLGYNRAAVLIRLRNAEKTREELVQKVNAAKDEITHLSYQSIELDDDIERLTMESNAAEHVKNDLQANLQKNLLEIKEERNRLTEALAGSGTQSFPLLNAQREILEARFSLLQQCISLPALKLSSSAATDSDSGTSSTRSTPPSTSLSVPVILTLQTIKEELTSTCKRLDAAIAHVMTDNSHLANAIVSLEEKITHVKSEEEARNKILSQLQGADNELGKAILRIKDVIQQMAKNVAALHSNNARRTLTNASIDAEELSRQQEVEEDLLHAISDAKIKMEALELQRSDNFRQMKMNQSRLNLLQGKKEEVWKTAKEINKLALQKKELLKTGHH